VRDPFACQTSSNDHNHDAPPPKLDLNLQVSLLVY
jgi:hypothetical protein